MSTLILVRYKDSSGQLPKSMHIHMYISNEYPGSWWQSKELKWSKNFQPFVCNSFFFWQLEKSADKTGKVNICHTSKKKNIWTKNDSLYFSLTLTLSLSLSLFISLTLTHNLTNSLSLWTAVVKFSAFCRKIYTIWKISSAFGGRFKNQSRYL
jgi:hypothetical protein